MWLPVWLMGLRVIWKDCFLPMHDDILRLWKDNGSLWLTQYLSEVCRIIVLWVGGTPYVQPTKGVRVRRTRYGLPVLLPGPLRNIFLLLKGEDHAYALKVIRVSLTVLSVYRVIGCSPNLKIGTITDPFGGSGATLPFWEVAKAVGLLPEALVIGAATWTYMSESAGPNFKKSTWSAGLDAIAFLRDPLSWYHWIMIAYSQRAFVLITWLLFTMLVSLPIVPLLMFSKKGTPKFLGRLVTLFEARGKVRIVAITDWWTQVLLAPLHKAIFNILKRIPQDGTFDQLGPVHSLIAYVRASGSGVYSYDLSAATDRLPVVFQVQVLTALGVAWAGHWAQLLTVRPWYLKSKPVFYSVGQPMGALSSWAMLAISHHILVQIASHRVGNEGWFNHYAVLGDDIVIADEKVARAYLSLIESLGVPINKSKSFEMASGGLEFAKRWIHPTYGDLSPIGPGLILAAIRNPRMLVTLFQDCLGRGYIFSTHVVSDLGRFLVMIRPRKWLDRHMAPIFSSVFGPTGGLWETASGPYYKAVWIASFPHRVADKLDELIDILYRLVVESQKPPLSEEESMAQLTSNFWKSTALTGSYFGGWFWAPLLLVSPSFWVYYDLAHRAEERVLDFQQKMRDFDTALWGREWMTLEGLGHIVRGHALARLVKSTFDPGLLDWKRKVAEQDVRIHFELIKAWARRVKVLMMSKRVTASYSRVTRSRRFVRYQTISTNLSLVPYGYWGAGPKQKILTRSSEIPSYGPSLVPSQLGERLGR